MVSSRMPQIQTKYQKVLEREYWITRFLDIHLPTLIFKGITQLLMHRRKIILTSLCFGLVTRALASSPWVQLSFDQTGDFGPQTPGTRTDGWQEALDFCVREGRDLYVKGGFGGGKAIYHIKDTIRFPPAQDFRVDGGVYVLNWEGPPDKDLVQLDSAMNCEYHLGILVYGGTGAGLVVRAEHPVPIDGFPAWIESQVFSQGIADPHPFQPGERKAGKGLVLDGRRVSIAHCEFYFASVLNFRTCVELVGDVSFNEVRVPHLHSNADEGTLMVAGEKCFGNQMRFSLGVDQGAKNVTGLVLGGRHNIIELGKRGSNRPIPKGRALLLTATAEGNQINIVDSELNDPEAIVTDNARVPSNQITWTGPPLPIRALANVGSDFVHTQRLYPAVLRWTGGQVRAVTLTRGGKSLDMGRGTDREILLSVGDQLRLQSATPPLVHLVPEKLK